MNLADVMFYIEDVGHSLEAKVEEISLVMGVFYFSEVRRKARRELREGHFWSHLILCRAGKLSTLFPPHHHMLPESFLFSYLKGPQILIVFIHLKC